MGLLSSSSEEKIRGQECLTTVLNLRRIESSMACSSPVPVFLASVRYRSHMFNANLFCPGYLAFSP